MTVEVDDVRKVLRGITNAMLPDETVVLWIDIAIMIVEANIGSHVVDGDKDRAIKIMASFYSLQSYATFVQTSSGRVPNMILTQMNELSKASSVLLSIISREEGAMAAPTTIVATTKSALDY